MTASPLIITPDVSANLRDLRAKARLKPVDIKGLLRTIKTPRGKRLHMDAMQAQTVVIPGPWPFFVTYSIETGHPAGTCRHMSMSVRREGRVPHPEAIKMIADEMGFVGGLEACTVWPEELSDGGTAINVVQPLSVQAAVHAD